MILHCRYFKIQFHHYVLVVLQAAMVTALPCYEPCLYYANLNAIRRVQLQNSTGKPEYGTQIQTIYQNGGDIGPLALDHANGRMFWYDFSSRMIYTANLDGTGSKVLISYGVSFCEGIAYDWSADNIYWTDSWHDWIEVASADGRNRKAIITGNMQQPRGIIVHPTVGYIFWTEFGANPRIERANLDGSERKAIVTTGLVYPNDLQIDFNAGRLYWIDAYTDRVESSKFDGTDRRVMTYFGGLLMHPYSMALFANHSLVYFTDWYRSWVFFKDLTSGSTINVLNRPPMRVLEIGQVRVLHESNQPSATSECLQNNGNCSHMCIRQNSTSIFCDCPTGLKLNAPGSNQCQQAELDYQVFVVDGSLSNSKIFHLSKFTGQAQYKFEVIQPPQHGLPVGLDYDQSKETIFWTDVRLNKIFKMHVNGSGFQTVIDDGIETPEGLQADFDTGLLYVADYNYEKIEVIKTDGSMRMDLITTDITNPRDLVLYHEKGLMFFSDWYQVAPKIESVHMDGTNRKPIITTTIETPSGLAIDKIEQRIYWCDMSLDRIESAKLDGTDRRILYDHYGYDPGIPLESVTGEIQTPYGLSLHGENIFWTDWRQRAVYSANKRIGGKINYITSGLEKPMQVHAYSNKRIKEYKKLYFFAHAKLDQSSLQIHSCFEKNCTGTYAEDPAPCPTGYEQTGFSETCANCSVPFGTYSYRCGCKDWMSCAHRVYSKLACTVSNPFMQFKVRECTQVVNPGHCPNTKCPTEASSICSSDGNCLDNQKCCNTSCGMKCLSSVTTPAKHQCQLNNGGCSHLCLRNPYNFTCGCPKNMILQHADNKTCILERGQCATRLPCANGGVCQDINSLLYVCKCSEGFSGKHCDECPACPSNTTCVKSGNAPECICNSNICKNGGTCSVSQNKTKCHCSIGYTGEKCETAFSCPENYCSGHGTCYLVNNAFKCQCTNQFTGKNCETSIPCISHECKNNGTCVLKNSTAVCQCNELFTGENCEVLKECVPNPCANDGICSNKGSTPVCTCKPGTTGKKCETILQCYSNPCYNNGTCTESAGELSCQCIEGYTGDRCQTYNPCQVNPCKNNASCSVVNQSSKCHCLPDFTGNLCESLIPCDANFCRNGGTCSISNNQRQCTCPEGYIGKYCDTHAVCSSNPCQNGGSCKSTSEKTFTCLCQSGFIGTMCEYIDRCLSNPCKNGGTCTNLASGAGYSCLCKGGTTGANCESVNACASNPCQNSGTCQPQGNGYTCNCISGYKGSNCATKDYCASSDCRESKLCVNGVNGYTCSCDVGYTGVYCRTRINYCGTGEMCENNGLCANLLQRAICICHGYYGGERCEVYYGENIIQLSLETTNSSQITAEAVKIQLGNGYTSYCKTTDCTGQLDVKRKRRNSKEPTVVTPDDVLIINGYPKSGEGSTVDLQYSVITKADGKTFVLPVSVLFDGFETMKSAFSTSLNVNVTAYKTITIKESKSKESKSNGDKNASKSGGLAAGLVVLFLALSTIIVVAIYILRKKRREKEAHASFNAFDNVLYQSNTDLQRKDDPHVQINRGFDEATATVTATTTSTKPLQMDNNVYDARRTYAEIDDIGTGLDRTNNAAPVRMEMMDGMTGVVNPYMEVPEHDRKLPYSTRTDSTPVGSSVNLKNDVLASIDDVHERVSLPDKKPTSLNGENALSHKEPMIVSVRSLDEDSTDGLSGFANPCAAVDDYIFSEDDTREGIEIIAKTPNDMHIYETPDDAKVAELNANNQGDLNSSLSSKNVPTVNEKGKWVNLESEVQDDSLA